MCVVLCPRFCLWCSPPSFLDNWLTSGLLQAIDAHHQAIKRPRSCTASWPFKSASTLHCFVSRFCQKLGCRFGLYCVFQGSFQFRLLWFLLCVDPQLIPVLSCDLFVAFQKKKKGMQSRTGIFLLFLLCCQEIELSVSQFCSAKF